MALKERLEALAQAVGTDVKTLVNAVGSLSLLTTSNKSSLVAAINELKATGGGGGNNIDDMAGAGAVDKTWSADKVTIALAALKSEILDGAPAAFDTLKEIADYLENNDSAVGGLVTAVGNRVSYTDTQALTVAQKLTTCQNIGVGDPEVDLLAIYTAAKA